MGPFNLVGTLYNGLLTLREISDYVYDQEVSNADAESAVEDAEWVLSKLRGFHARDFESFPLLPPP